MQLEDAQAEPIDRIDDERGGVVVGRVDGPPADDLDRSRRNAAAVVAAASFSPAAMPGLWA